MVETQQSLSAISTSSKGNTTLFSSLTTSTNDNIINSDTSTRVSPSIITGTSTALNLYKEENPVNFVKKDKDQVQLFYNNKLICQLPCNTTIAKRVNYINIYWNYLLRNNCTVFEEYVKLLTSIQDVLSSGDTNKLEEYNVLLYNRFLSAVDEVSNFFIKKYDIVNEWVNKSKKTTTSIFIDEDDTRDICHLISGLIVGFPLVLDGSRNVTTSTVTNSNNNSDVLGLGSKRVWSVPNVLEKLTTLHKRSIHLLMKLGLSKVKFDSFKDGYFFKSLLNPSSAFLANFCFVLFSLVACSTVFLPEEYSTSTDKRLVNFYGYFVSVVSDNQRFLLQSFPLTESVDSNILSSMLRKEISYDLLQTLYSTLLVHRVCSNIDPKVYSNIKTCYPTPLTHFTNEIMKVCLGIPVSTIERYGLEFQYVMYKICSKNAELSKKIGSGLELLRIGSKDPAPISNKRVGGDLPIITSLMSRDVSYLDILVNKIRKLNKVKAYKLYYIDDSDKEFLGIKNKMLSDFAQFYIRVVIDSDPLLVLGVQKMFHKLGLNIKDKHDLQIINSRII